jgi:hypothetical protein
MIDVGMVYDPMKKGEKMKEKKNMGKEANMGFVERNDEKTATRLLDKNWSPLIVRKYQMKGWPLFIGIICDANLNDLDTVVYDLTEKAESLGFTDGSIQGVRNYCGFLNDGIVNYYNSIKRGCAEGVMVCWYVDKMWCSSAFGDLMVHEKCVMEFYQIVNTLPHI